MPPSFPIIRERLFNYLNLQKTFSFPLLSLFSRRICCWKCGSLHKNGLYCSTCNALQEPSKINYFELLAVNVSYDIDMKALVPRYHNLQILYHPDKHSNEDAISRKKSEEFSTAANKAYATLIDPVNRAFYILKLKGISLDETTSSQNPELLMSILQYDDEISKIKQSEDAQTIMQNIDIEFKKLSRLASDYFKNEDYEAAKNIVIQMKYYANILKRLKAKIQEMGLDI